MGADIVLNHHDDLVQQFCEHGEFVDFIFCTYDTDMYYNTMIELKTAWKDSNHCGI